ncbi:MAG: filamentous hemagglutinin N-terminal domain-containing protein, partial [Verrucomicrobiota bacterium]
MPFQFPRWAKSVTTAALVASMPLLAVPSYANPLGGQVITGDVTIHEVTGSTLNIDQLSDRAIIEWQSFSIDNGELTQFFQPGAQAAILNRVTGGSPSEINGALRGNGNVWVINQNGVLFGANSTVDVFGLVASTLDVSNESFIAGGDMPLSGDGLGDTVNFGTINAVGGDVFLVGRSVVNHGAIGAVDGTVGLAAGNRVLLNATGSERVFVSAGEGSVTNSGEIRSAMAELKAHGNVGALAINNSGIIRVSGADVDDGRIMLSAANGDVSNTGEMTALGANGSGGGIEIRSGMGEIQIGGILSASGSGNAGGNIALLAPGVRVEADTTVSANGTDGGRIQVGSAADAGRVEVMAGASINADGEVGNGGSVEVTAGEVVFYPNSTLGAEGEIDGGAIAVQSSGLVQADGRASASGRIGNGGMVDLSGENVLVGQTGVLAADGGIGGTVAVTAANEARVEGQATVVGTADLGGTVNVTGDVVSLGTQALVDASGATGGGFVNIGGGFQGKIATLRNSSETNVAAGAVIRADATQSGNGGQIAVWSDGDTVFHGFASVAGIGNGGVVEVSGKEKLTYAGTVDLSGANGENGFLILDPVDVSIGQVNTDGTGTIGDTDAQEPGLGTGVIDADALITAWNSGNVVVHTSGVGSGVGKIDIESDVQIIGNSSNSLSFFAHEDINVGVDPAGGGDRGAVQIINHGTGNISLIAGWDGGGESLFGPNLVANADPSNAVDGTSTQVLAPTGSISAADLRAGTY